MPQSRSSLTLACLTFCFIGATTLHLLVFSSPMIRSIWGHTFLLLSNHLLGCLQEQMQRVLWARGFIVQRIRVTKNHMHAGEICPASQSLSRLGLCTVFTPFLRWYLNNQWTPVAPTWQNDFYPTSITLRPFYLQPGPHSCRMTILSSVLTISGSRVRMK